MKVEQAEADYTAAQAAYNDYQAEKYVDVARALETYDENLLTIKNQAGQLVEVAPWFTDGTPYDFVRAITGNNFGGDATKGQALSVKMNESTAEYDYRKVWGTEEGLYLGFLSIYEGGSYESVDLSEFSEDWSIAFSFQSFDPVPIILPNWYDSGVVQGRRNGPFRTGFSGYYDPDNPNDVYFFGDGGILSRMLTQMWVAYRPTVTLNAGTTIHTYVQEKIEAGGSLQIGPFNFGASGGSETESTFDFSQGTEIIAQAQGDWPYIVCNLAVETVPSQEQNDLMRAVSRRNTAMVAASKLPVRGRLLRRKPRILIR